MNVFRDDWRGRCEPPQFLFNRTYSRRYSSSNLYTILCRSRAENRVLRPGMTKLIYKFLLLQMWFEFWLCMTKTVKAINVFHDDWGVEQIIRCLPCDPPNAQVHLAPNDAKALGPNVCARLVSLPTHD